MPSLNPIIFTPLGVIFAHFLFFFSPLLLLTGHTNGRGYSGDFMQIRAGEPLNTWLQVLIALRWSHRLLRNERRKVVLPD